MLEEGQKEAVWAGVLGQGGSGMGTEQVCSEEGQAGRPQEALKNRPQVGEGASEEAACTALERRSWRAGSSWWGAGGSCRAEESRPRGRWRPQGKQGPWFGP